MGAASKLSRLAGRLVAAALAVALLLPMVPEQLATPAAAVTQTEIDNLKNDASALDAQKKKLEKQLAAIAKDKSKAMEQKGLLEEQMDVIQSEIAIIDRQIAGYTTLIQQLDGELAANVAEEERLYELFCQCVRYMEEDGTTNYWAILFNATSFSDLLDRLIMIDEIVEYNDAVMDSLRQARARIQTDKEAQELARAELQAARDKQEAARKELQAKEAEVDKLLRQINSEQKQVEHSVKELEAQAKAMDAEIARKERELAAKLAQSGNKIVTETGYLWPLPGYTALSSLFAGRKDPFTGKPATHSGIDVPAPRGVKILAAKSGVVITSAYNKGGYGNYVVVSHGDGNTTLYAHMNSRAVKEGATVKQGDVLGYVGTTGRSTGNHLHYEIRVNNTRIDPVTKYPGKLTYKGSVLK